MQIQARWLAVLLLYLIPGIPEAATPDAQAGNQSPPPDFISSLNGPNLTPFKPEFSALVAVGVVASDNAGLEANGPLRQSAEATQESFGFVARDRRPTFEYDVSGGVTGRQIFSVDYPSETLPQLSGGVRWSPIPERLSLVVEDQLGQISQNSANTLNSADYQRTNVASAGPDLRLPIGQSFWVAASARGTKSSFEDTDIDSDKLAGILGVEYQDSKYSSIGLFASSARTHYSESQSVDNYAVDAAYLNYSSIYSRTRIDAQVGEQRLELGEQSTSGPKLEVKIRRVLSPFLTGFFEADRTYDDSSGIFVWQQGLDQVATNNSLNVQLVSQPALLTRGSLGVDFHSRRLVARFYGSYSQDRYVLTPVGTTVTQGVNRNYGAVAARVSYSLGPRLSALGLAYLSQEDRDGLATKPVETQYIAGLQWRIGRQLMVRGGYYRDQRRRDVSTNDYTENRVFAEIQRSFGNIPNIIDTW